jgi:hypothetical protein
VSKSTGNTGSSGSLYSDCTHELDLAFFSVLRVGLLTGILLVGEYSVGTGLALQRLSQLLCLIHNVQRQLLLDLIMRYTNSPFGSLLSSDTPLYLIV